MEENGYAQRSGVTCSKTGRVPKGAKCTRKSTAVAAPKTRRDVWERPIDDMIFWTNQ